MEDEVKGLREEIMRLEIKQEQQASFLCDLKDKMKFMQIELLISEVALIVLALLHVLGR